MAEQSKSGRGGGRYTQHNEIKHNDTQFNNK